MAKLSRNVREIIKTSVFLLVVALLLLSFIIYPMIKTKTISARADIDEFDADSLISNDMTLYIEKGIAPDSFRIETDGLTKIAALYLPPTDSLRDSVQGTVILLHADGGDRDDLVNTATALSESGFAVIAYDQRASGRSTGKYRGDGRHEADDLVAILSYLALRDRLKAPVIIAGSELGADAAILAALDDNRITAVLAISPYLSSLRMQNMLKKKYDLFWIPFYRSVMWFWYGIRSGYEPSYRKAEDIKPVACRTLLLIDSEMENETELERLVDISDNSLLSVKNLSLSTQVVHDEIVAFAKSIR